MDAGTGASDVDELAEVVSAIDELLELINLGREVIDLEGLTRETGIPARRLIELLDGSGPVTSPEAASSEQQVFVDRLRFLRENRRAPGGKRFTLDEIGAAIGTSHGAVGYMMNGERTPKLTVAAKLERFFNVTPGFFTASEHQLLLGALRPIRDELKHLALLRGKGITQIALRSSATADDSSFLAKELRSAVAAVLTQQTDRGREEDAEVRELTQQLTSLPAKSRRRVVPLIRGLLGLASGDSSEDANERARNGR